MAVSKRGQGSKYSCHRNTKPKRNYANNTTKSTTTSRCTKTEETGVGEEVKRKFNKVEWYCYAFVVTAAFSCYSMSPFGEFLHDDVFAILENADIRSETPVSNLFMNDYWGKSMRSPESHKSYRPLCVLSFRVQFWLHGLNPFGYRLVNVCLHVFVCVSFVRLCETVLLCSQVFSVMSGLLFAVHPIHSEAVNAVVGRADILACLLFLLALGTYARSIPCPIQTLVDKNENKVKRLVQVAVSSSKSPRKSLILCIVFGSAAMLAKENGVTVFGVCILYDFMVVEHCHDRFPKKRFLMMYFKWIIRGIILISVIIFLLCFRMHLQNSEIPHFSAEENPAFHSNSSRTKLLTYSYLAFFNAWLLLVPVTLCYDWQMGSIPLVESLHDVRNLTTVIFFVGLLVLFVLSAMSSILKESERKICLTGLLLLTIPFLPASNIFFPVGFVVAERILYIPSLGYCVLINFAFAKQAGISISAKDENFFCSPKTRRCRAITAVLYLLMLGGLTWKTRQRNNVWQTRETLFRSGVETVPQNAKVHYNYANYLKVVGRNEEAIHHYNVAINLAPRHSSSHNNLGTLLGNSQEAVDHFKLAIKYNPRHANAHLNIGALFRVQNKLDKSEKYLKESLRLNPQSVNTILSLADIMEKQHRTHDIDKLYENSVQIEKTEDAVVLWNSYGVFLESSGRYAEAVFSYDRAITLAPEHTWSLMNKVRVLMSLKKFQMAEFYLKRFLKENKEAIVYEQLGVLFYKFKRFSEAAEAWQNALEIDPELPETFFNYALLLKDQGHKEKAFFFLVRYFKTQPDSAEVNKDVISMMHEMGYLAEALETVKNALLVFKDPVFYYLKGNILKDMGLFLKAIDAYKIVIKLDPKFVDVNLNIGAVYHLLKKFEYAKMYYQRALAHDPHNKLVKKNLEKLAMRYMHVGSS